MAKILLVEDNEMNRDMLSRRLAKKGHDVAIAVDGKEGVEMASEGPEIILLDMSLPVMDGWEAARILKADASTKDIPIIALTAHAMAGDSEKCIEAGADQYYTLTVDTYEGRLRGMGYPVRHGDLPVEHGAVRLGDIDTKIAGSALAAAADQDRAPGKANLDIGHGDRLVAGVDVAIG